MALDTKNLLKISDVAKLSDTKLTTVKYYVKEGLVDFTCKTGKNMAWYSMEAVERVKLIKKLQSEKYYPLSVIKRILREGADAAEVKLLDIINRADASDFYESISYGEAVKTSGLKIKDAEKLVESGLIKPLKDGRTKLCNHGDLHIMQLVKQRLDAGIPLNETIKVFCIYENALETTARTDIECLVDDCLLKEKMDTEDIVRIISVSDVTLDSFIGMRRYALNAQIGAEFISQAENMIKSLKDFVFSLCELMESEGRFESEKLLTKMLASRRTGVEEIDCFGDLINFSGGGIANALSALHKVSLIFEKSTEKKEPEIEFLKASLELGWRSISSISSHFNADTAKEVFLKRVGDNKLAYKVLQLI